MNRKHFLLAAVIVLIVGAGAMYVASSNDAQIDEPITIGFVAPLTGDAAAFGEDAQKGVQLAVDEINNAGGINGRAARVVYEDGKCDGKEAANAAQKLVNVDKVKYIIGGACSGEALAMLPITSAANVLLLSPSASAPKLSGASPYFVRNYPNDAAPGADLAKYASRAYETVAVVSENTEYALGLREVFVREAEKNGLKVVMNEAFVENTTDFRTLLLKVRATNPDVLFINPQNGSGVARIAMQARQLGITADFLGISYTGPDVLAAGDAVESMVFAVAPGLAEDKGMQLIKKYEERYGTKPAYPYVVGAAYDHVYLLKKAVESRGDDATDVASYLRTMPVFPGTIGTYSFDNNGDVVGIEQVFQTVRDGKIVALEE